jgi:hypothetical protein
VCGHVERHEIPAWRLCLQGRVEESGTDEGPRKSGSNQRVMELGSQVSDLLKIEGTFF